MTGGLAYPTYLVSRRGRTIALEIEIEVRIAPADIDLEHTLRVVAGWNLLPLGLLLGGQIGVFFDRLFVAGQATWDRAVDGGNFDPFLAR